jgi:hypothetical protein
LNFVPGRGLSYAIAFDDQPPQIVDALAHNSTADWSTAVKDSVRKVRSEHTISNPGYHVLKFWMVDPGIVLAEDRRRRGRCKAELPGPPGKLLSYDPWWESMEEITDEMKRMSSPSKLATVILIFLALATLSAAQTHWVGSWASSQMLAEQDNALDPSYVQDVTLRQVIRASLGGDSLRLRLSNRFGTTPLHLTEVHVAQPAAVDSGRIVAGTDKALTFGGAPDVWISAGAEYLSDPIDFPVAPLSSLAFTLHVDSVPANQTGASRVSSHLVSCPRKPSLGC